MPKIWQLQKFCFLFFIIWSSICQRTCESLLVLSNSKENIHVMFEELNIFRVLVSGYVCRISMAFEKLNICRLRYQAMYAGSLSGGTFTEMWNFLWTLSPGERFLCLALFELWFSFDFINRYNEQRKMSSLEEVFISQASAKQRQGRAGRVRDGICFRMFTKYKYSQLRSYSQPEIQRVPLEGLCLHILVRDSWILN